MAGCTMNGERKIIMAKYRKLGRTSAQRKALLRNQVTAVINNGKIVTTEAKAKEVQKIVDGLIALAVKEKDNFETVKVTTKVARKDKDGKRVKQIVDKETGKVLAESHRDRMASWLRSRTVLPLLYTTKLRRRSRRICLPDLMHVVRC